MKKILYILSLSLIFLIISCDKESKPNNLNIELVSSTSSGQDKFYKYDLTIPQIKNDQSEDFTYFNLTMQENMRYVLENLSEKKDDGGIQSACITFKNNENNFGVLSITILTSIYTGGAHSKNILESYNFNLKDKSILSSDKIFKEEANEYFNMKINDMIKNHVTVFNTQGKEVIFFDNAEANIDNSIVSFEGDNIIFTFSEYDLAPYSSGMPVFKFNKKEIKKYLNF